MIRSLRFTLAIISALTAFALGAQQPSFSLIPPRAVVQGRNFTLTFRLSDGEANPPAAPTLDGCTLLYGPSTSTMYNTSIVNGRMTSSSSIDYSFVYKADKPGSVTVPAVSITVEGKKLSSRESNFNILPDDSAPAASGSHGNRHGHPDDPSSRTPGRIEASDLLVRVFFSKSKVYEQEPVIATIKVYTKYDISSFLVTTQPAFEGFLCEELPVNLEAELEHYNGQNYHTAVLKRLLLYPQKAGKLSVNSGKYDVTLVQQEIVNMGFFRTTRPVERQVTTSSKAATLTVEALPEPRPAGFNGAVGHFSVATELTPELLRTNEAATYSYIVKGTGNIKYLSEPSVEFPAGIDAYTPKTDINTRVSGANMTGTYRTDFTIVPQEIGDFSIPGTNFVYFNPDSRSYETIEVAARDFKVVRGATTSGVISDEQTAVQAEIEDINHIHRSDSSKQRHSISYTIDSPWYWLAYVCATALLAGIVLAYRRRIRLDADVTGRRLARAGRVANRRLKEARGYMNSHRNELFYDSLAKALWGYIGDKLSIAPSQLMRDNIAEKLRSFGASAETTDQVIDVLDLCEMARFTPNHSDREVAELYDKAVAAIHGIESVRK